MCVKIVAECKEYVLLETVYRYVRPQGYGFSAVLVIKRVSILADFGHK